MPARRPRCRQVISVARKNPFPACAAHPIRCAQQLRNSVCVGNLLGTLAASLCSASLQAGILVLLPFFLVISSATRARRRREGPAVGACRAEAVAKAGFRMVLHSFFPAIFPTWSSRLPAAGERDLLSFLRSHFVAQPLLAVCVCRPRAVTKLGMASGRPPRGNQEAHSI
jgi:hypothetical protein